MMKTGLLAAMVLVWVGCGGSGGSSGTAPTIAPVPPVVLQDVQIAPQEADLFVGDTVAITVIAYYSDGTFEPIVASWENGAPGVASTDVTHGAVAVATALDYGTCTLTALVDGIHVVATLHVSVDDSTPGAYYGASWDTNSLWAYEPGGAAPDSFANPGSGLPSGIALDPDGRTLFVVTDAGELYRFDTTTLAGVLVASFGGPVYTLDLDSDGDVIAGNWSSFLRYSRTTGAVTNDGPVPQTFAFGIGPDDARYWCDAIGRGIYRNGEPWGTTWGFDALVIPGGIYVSDRGIAYVIPSITSTEILRFQDVNGNGSAIDLGESDVHASLPASQFALGITPCAGEGLLINVQPWSGPGGTGVYRITYGGDVSLENPTCVYNGIDGRCIAGRDTRRN